MMPSGIESSGNFAFVFCASKLRGRTGTELSESVSQLADCLTVSWWKMCCVLRVLDCPHSETFATCCSWDDGFFRQKRENEIGVKCLFPPPVMLAGVMALGYISGAWSIPELHVYVPPGGSANAGEESQQDFYNQPQQSNTAFCKMS